MQGIPVLSRSGVRGGCQFLVELLRVIALSIIKFRNIRIVLTSLQMNTERQHNGSIAMEANTSSCGAGFRVQPQLQGGQDAHPTRTLFLLSLGCTPAQLSIQTGEAYSFTRT